MYIFRLTTLLSKVLALQALRKALAQASQEMAELKASEAAWHQKFKCPWLDTFKKEIQITFSRGIWGIWGMDVDGFVMFCASRKLEWPACRSSWRSRNKSPTKIVARKFGYKSYKREGLVEPLCLGRGCRKVDPTNVAKCWGTQGLKEWWQGLVTGNQAGNVLRTPGSELESFQSRCAHAELLVNLTMFCDVQHQCIVPKPCRAKLIHHAV